MQQIAGGVDQRQFQGCGTGVDPQKGIAGIPGQVAAAHGGVGVAFGETPVFLLVAEQGGERLVCRQPGAEALRRGCRIKVFAGHRLALRRQGGADGDQIGRTLGTDYLVRRQPQRFGEASPQLGQEMKRPANQGHFAPDGPALGQAADCLVDDRLQDRGGDVLFRHPVVHQGLHVGFGEHAAAGGDRVDGAAMLGQLVQAGRIGVQQRRHVVDEGTGAAGADAVHPLFHRRAQISDLGVLAAQFDGGVGVGDQVADGGGGSDHFLHERQAEGLGNADAGRSGHNDGQQFLPQDLLRFGRDRRERRGDIRKMPGVLLKHDFALLVQNDHFDGGRTDVDADAQCCSHSHPSHSCWRFS